MTPDSPATRRDVVRRGALLGGLAVVATGAGPLRAIAQGGGDAPILARLVRLERAAQLAYGAAYRRRLLSSELRRTAREFRDQHRDHDDALASALRALGGRVPAGPASDSGVDGLAPALAAGPRAFLDLASG